MKWRQSLHIVKRLVLDINGKAHAPSHNMLHASFEPNTTDHLAEGAIRNWRVAVSPGVFICHWAVNNELPTTWLWFLFKMDWMVHPEWPCDTVEQNPPKWKYLVIIWTSVFSVKGIHVAIICRFPTVNKQRFKDPNQQWTDFTHKYWLKCFPLCHRVPKTDDKTHQWGTLEVLVESYAVLEELPVGPF